MNIRVLVAFVILLLLSGATFLVYHKRTTVDRPYDDYGIRKLDNAPPVKEAEAETYVIEIEHDGDININGVEVFDPEDAAKAIEKGKELAEDVQEKGSEVASKVAEKTSEAAASVSEKVSEVASKVKKDKEPDMESGTGSAGGEGNTGSSE